MTAMSTGPFSPYQNCILSTVVDCPNRSLDNVSGTRVGGPTRLALRHREIINEADDAEKPKDEPTPVHQLIIRRSA